MTANRPKRRIDVASAFRQKGIPRSGLAFAAFAALLFACSLATFLYKYFAAFGWPVPADEPVWPNVSANIALFTIFALHHSVLARSGPKQLVERVLTPALERPFYVFCASVLFLAVCLLWRPVPGELYRLEGAASLPGYIVQLTGIVLTARGASAIGAADLAGLRLVREADGETPAATLETSGLYGLVRHPLYFSWMLVVFGAPHMTMTRFVFAAVSTGYLAAAIPLEERGLIRTFGDDYRRYRQQVRWRMIPGIY
jgi:protein-S-isoprenylcysteine O-methyltransferase Ste14